MGRKKRKYPRHKRRRNHPTLSGTLRVEGNGTAVVSTQEGSFTVARKGLREAMSGDTVAISLIHTHVGQALAVVQSVVERATKTFLARYEKAGPLGVLVPLDTRLRHDFFIVPEDTSAERYHVQEDDVVEGRILEYPTRLNSGTATIERRIGAAEDLDMGIEGILASYDLPHEFPERVLQAAEKLADDTTEATQEPDRKDLREVTFVTIDPLHARDFDDAVFGRMREDGGYEVLVAIADVTHYVKWDSPIDLEARRRTCSVYLADRVIPMLPEKLSNDLCSLMPNTPRLAMAVKLELDAHGHVQSAEPTKAVISSKARLNYDEVDEFLAGERPAEKLNCRPEYVDTVAESLRVLHHVAEKRAVIRAQRGALDFPSREARVQLDQDGRPTGVLIRSKTPATSLVEEAMLLANETVARLLAGIEAPAAFRVHPQPTQKDLKELVPIFTELGLLKGHKQIDAFCSGQPEAQARILKAAEKTPNTYLVSTLLLRAQSRAIYLPHNEGHYALGTSAYCHFTSPIRRYADDTVHRALKAYLAHKRNIREQHAIAAVLPQLCADCSSQERVADAAACDSEEVKMAELYAAHIGEVFPGIIDGCKRFGVFVMLNQTCAEGMIPVRSLGEEYFEYDEKHMRLIGRETGTIYQIGQPIMVEVAACDTLRGRIEFRRAKQPHIRIKGYNRG